MTVSANKPFSEEEKVRILLNEYATLRSEILGRTNHMYQLGAAGTVLVLWTIGRPVGFGFWFGLTIALVALPYFFWLISRDVQKAATRLRELEKESNSRAGETLLVWETRWGGAVTGIWGKGKPEVSRADNAIRGAVTGIWGKGKPLPPEKID
jgi:hypothetical protein